MTPAGIEAATFRFVAQYLNHCGAAVPTILCTILNYMEGIGNLSKSLVQSALYGRCYNECKVIFMIPLSILSYTVITIFFRVC